MPATFSQCFPDPLSSQWPATNHPVLCECRQLYVLVSVCCCVSSAHLLVLHDGACNTTVTSMPKGPTYLELRLTEQTSSETFCSFVSRAETASSTGNNIVEGKQRPVNIICLTGLAAATPSVQSALMDVLQFSVVRVGGEVRRVPSLRIVAYCDARVFATAVPEWLRAGFALSTYMSSFTMESAAVIQSTDSDESNVVNRRNMLEVMLSEDGCELVDTVTLSCEVSRYLRHLLIVLRGAMLHHSVPGCYIPGRVPLLFRLLKVVALLFARPLLSRAREPPFSLRSPALLKYQRQQRQEQLPRDTTPITSFVHVMVSPAHVMGLLCPMVAHLFTIRREMATTRIGDIVHGYTNSGHFVPNIMISAGGGDGVSGNSNSNSVENDDNRAGGELSLTVFEMLDSVALRWLSQEAGQRETEQKTAGRGMNGIRGSTNVALHASRESLDKVLSYPECRELICVTVIKHSAPPSG